MFHDLRAAVTERYAQELTEMDRTEFEDFVTRETESLLSQVAQAQSNTEMSVIAAWKTANGGVDPDTLTLAGLYRQARYTAEEVALATLWEGYQDPDDREDAPAAGMSGMDRWLTEFAIEANPEIEDLAEQVWPDQTPRFQVWAEQLLQARVTDGLMLPDGPQHPLVPELTQMVSAALADHEAAVARARR